MDVKLTKSQYEFLTSTEPIVFLLGGIGAGKSFVLAHVILNHINEYPNSNILLVANTHAQLINATIPALTNLLDDLGIQYKKILGGAKKSIQVNNVTIFLYSLELYDNIRGIEVGLVAGDEIAYSRIEAFNVIMGRLRCKRGALRARLVSSPNGFNFVYDLVNSRRAEAIHSKTKDNPFVPSSYVESLIALYGGEDTPLAKQELQGQFVNLTSGSVYYGFDRSRNVSANPLKFNSLLPVYVGLDFNIDKMTFTYCQYEAGKLYVIKEVVLDANNSNTFDAAIRIKSDMAQLQLFPKVVPDSTGKSRKTSAEAGRTDIQILKDAGLQVVETQNPRIKDRHNTLNSLMLKGELIIDASCTNLIKEIETLKHEDDEGSVVHLSVGVGYVAWKLAPLKPVATASQTLTNPFLKTR